MPSYRAYKMDRGTVRVVDVVDYESVSDCLALAVGRELALEHDIEVWISGRLLGRHEPGK